jgi:xylulokinase
MIGATLMILAIDLGSTSFKAGLFDERLRPVWSRAVALRYHYGVDGCVELRVEEVERALRSVLPRRRAISVVAVTSQAQTFTVVDGAGRAKRPFVSWQDGRAGKACAQLRRRLPDAGEHGSFAGLLPALQVCQMRHHPPARGQTALLLPSYFIRRWTGQSVTDENIAAMSGLYSVAAGGWWPEGLRACNLMERQLPRVQPMGSIAGLTVGNDYGLPAGVPVVLAGNDQTAGAYGAQLDVNNATLLTLGTAQVAYRCVARMPAARPDLIRGPYPGGQAYRMAADAFGGNLVNWARTVLAGCGTTDGFDAVAATAPSGCRGVVFEPGDGLAVGGGWRNVGLHHGSGELARAVLETLARRMAHLVCVVCPGQLHGVRVAGGGARSALWRSILAEQLGIPVVRTDATPLTGAARLAADAMY